MLIAKPQSLLEAFKLTKAFEVRHEEIVRDSRATNRGWSYKTTFPVRDSRAGNDGHTLPHEVLVTQFPSSKGLLPTPPPSSKGVATSTVPIRRMSAAEVQARREKGLCFYYDQKYSHGHRCRRSLHLLIAADDSGEDGNDLGEPDTVLEESHADEEITGDISALNTLAGQGNPRSLRLWGDISRQKCLVLIDSGSTHNFIKPSTVEMLQLPIQPVKPFQVYIGSGDTLLCSHYCPNVIIVLQGTTFQIDLHVLLIAGPDVVLGIIWLQSLGTVAHDYAKLIMKFKYNNNMVTLKGEMSFEPQPISFSRLEVLVDSKKVDCVFALYQLTPENNTLSTIPENPPTLTILTNLPDPFQNLLQEFSLLFVPPTTLPPKRQFDHQIHLLPETNPVNVRP
nr:Transposon Ty3-G Gag-Pol polyprotein [Ipomoea batatas]